jgi:hypothetical protein
MVMAFRPKQDRERRKYESLYREEDVVFIKSFLDYFMALL